MSEMHRSIIALAASIICSTCAIDAKTLIVGKPNTPCPNAQFATITAAVAAAAPGDVIEICPALYDEQVLVTKALTLRGIAVNNVDRVLIRPSGMSPVGGAATEAVITVLDARQVRLENLAVDASNNGVSGCAIPVAGIYFYNTSGVIAHNAVFNALVTDPQNCPLPQLLLFGSGFGVQVDSAQQRSFDVVIGQNSIHDYTRNGVLVTGVGVNADINHNTITGIGPAIGVVQFGVFLANGAVAAIRENVITEGLCGALSVDDCVGRRSEGVTLRAPGNGTVVERNVITDAQSGIFVNGGQQMTISNNEIRNIQGLDGIDIQGTASGGFTESEIAHNRIVNVTPIGDFGCGVAEFSGTGVSANTLRDNIVNDAYCGVALVSGDRLFGGEYFNTLYEVLDADAPPPPPTEP